MYIPNGSICTIPHEGEPKVALETLFSSRSPGVAFRPRNVSELLVFTEENVYLGLIGIQARGFKENFVVDLGKLATLMPPDEAISKTPLGTFPSVVVTMPWTIPSPQSLLARSPQTTHAKTSPVLAVYARGRPGPAANGNQEHHLPSPFTYVRWAPAVVRTIAIDKKPVGKINRKKIQRDAHETLNTLQFYLPNITRP